MRDVYQATGRGSFRWRWKVAANVHADEMDVEYFTHERLGRLLVAKRGPLAISVPALATDDFIISISFDLLVKRRALEVLSAQVGGLTFEPVRLIDTPHIDELWRVREGFAGFVSSTERVRMKDRYDPIDWYSFQIDATYGDLLDRTQIADGVDMFVMWPFPAIHFVTEHFRNVYREAGLTGLAFVPIAKLDPIEGSVSPGPPALWLSEKNIAKLKADPKYIRLLADH